MRIAEIYRSIQGEGELTGVESVFIRTSGCNLRCHYCDTPFASWFPEGDDWAVNDVLDEVNRLGASHVVITGGEPMLFAELVPLCERLSSLQKHITIETAGTLFQPLHCDLMSISPKLSNSAPDSQQHPQWHRRHEITRHAPEVIQDLVRHYHYQFKFVIADPADCDEVLTYLQQFPDVHRSRIMLMPEGTSPERLSRVGHWLEPYCEQSGFTFCARKQIEWFGNQRRT
ncbi:MAG: 7-carboxy-7-deazaguanine synthase QueE [Pirellulaceae bacterium]